MRSSIFYVCICALYTNAQIHNAFSVASCVSCSVHAVAVCWIVYRARNITVLRKVKQTHMGTNNADQQYTATIAEESASEHAKRRCIIMQCIHYIITLLRTVRRSDEGARTAECKEMEPQLWWWNSTTVCSSICVPLADGRGFALGKMLYMPVCMLKSNSDVQQQRHTSQCFAWSEARLHFWDISARVFA